MAKMKVRIYFTDETLGTKPGEKDVHEKFVASKAPDAKTREEEIAEHGVAEEIEKSKTIFLRDTETGDLILEGYQIQGFFKEVQKAFNDLAKIEPETYKKLYMTNYKKNIDTEIKILPKNIKVHLPEDAEVGDCQRPLRAETAQGPRVALANSETFPKGAWIEFCVVSAAQKRIEQMEHCLNYGVFHGMGQWRNSGKGTFYWDKLDNDGEVIGGNRCRWEEMKKEYGMN